MIPDIAVIISAYAIARLTGEYLLDEASRESRIVISILAIAVIGYFLFDVFQKSNSLSSTLGGFNLG
jgi:hypothetical protein